MDNFVTGIGPSLFIAIALALDGFSVCLMIGLRRLSYKKMFYIGSTIGFFHIIFPLFGLWVGQQISYKWANTASVVGGLMLVFMGIHILLSAFEINQQSLRYTSNASYLLLALIVSVDGFPVGLSLGFTTIHTAIFITLSGSFALLSSFLGMMIGNKISHIMGTYSEISSGLILLLFGLYYMFF